MEFKEIEDEWYMVPSPDESYILSIISPVSTRHKGMIPIGELDFTKGIFDEIKYGANYNIEAIREAREMTRLSDTIFHHKLHESICDTALSDIGAFILAHPEYEEKEPTKILSLVDDAPEPDPAN